jgi:hypothetical protein
METHHPITQHHGQIAELDGYNLLQRTDRQIVSDQGPERGISHRRDRLRRATAFGRTCPFRDGKVWDRVLTPSRVRLPQPVNGEGRQSTVLGLLIRQRATTQEWAAKTPSRTALRGKPDYHVERWPIFGSRNLGDGSGVMKTKRACPPCGGVASSSAALCSQPESAMFPHVALSFPCWM